MDLPTGCACRLEKMTDVQGSADLADFIAGEAVAQKWDAARRLMANKKLQASVSEAGFQIAFESLESYVKSASDLDRLLAVDLLVRMPAAAKTLLVGATRILQRALGSSLPPTWTVSDAAVLPAGAKPAEIRENVAQALCHATGDWVPGYLIDALAREDRSQRCRSELCRQLLARNIRFGHWLDLLASEKWGQILPESAPLEGRLTRLRDLASAIAEAVRANRMRLVLEPKDGEVLDRLVRGVARVPPKEPPSARMTSAASEVVRLLDEMIAAEFTLATEQESYEVIETFQGWWRPYPFPEELTSDLAHIQRRLTSAITLRARMGQRSDNLAARLGQSLGPGRRVAEVLKSIADQNIGLAAEIDGWLRGRTRTTSATAKAASALLGSTSSGDLIASIGPLLLDCREARDRSGGRDPDITRICNTVDAIASALRLSIAGAVGEVVEYRPSTHSTADGSTPANPIVRIIRPMVVRERFGGSLDVIVRAIVAPA